MSDYLPPPNGLVEQVTLRAIMEIIASAKGTCVTFTPKKVAIKAGLDTKPVTLTVVKSYIEELREKGLVKVWGTRWKYYRTRKGRVRRPYIHRYIVTRESPLWQEAKKAPLEKLAEVRG